MLPRISATDFDLVQPSPAAPDDSPRRKPVILAFTRHYLPGFRAGGPVRTLTNMVEQLGDLFEFRIVTIDRDLGDSTAYPGVPSGEWMECGKGFVLYLAPRYGLRKIVQLVRSTAHDLIYLNSLFDPWFTQRILLSRRMGWIAPCPVVLAPRGECAAGALTIRNWRKSAFLGIARLLRLHSGLVWQASSDGEARDITRMGFVVTSTRAPGSPDSISVAPNLVDSRPLPTSRPPKSTERKDDNPLLICFLSRISPMKNLEFALHVLMQVHSCVRFSIYGPIEDRAYWSSCKTLIAKLPSNVEVRYQGVVRPAEVTATLAQHDIFFLPTHGENFGHVIHEALHAGLTLLISDRTPWKGLDECGVGWDLPLDDTATYARAIEEASRWSPEEREARVVRAQALAERIGCAPGTLDANIHLFLDTLDRAKKAIHSPTEARQG